MVGRFFGDGPASVRMVVPESDRGISRDGSPRRVKDLVVLNPKNSCVCCYARSRLAGIQTHTYNPRPTQFKYKLDVGYTHVLYRIGGGYGQVSLFHAHLIVPRRPRGSREP